MKGFIEEFYYGNIEPQECTGETTQKIRTKLGEVAEKEKILTGKLTGTEKEAFDDYVNTCINLTSLSCTDSFIRGFRLGAEFTYDTFVRR
ncbi:MAG: hypothetical protein IJN88_05955 [Clostridia bacterium]|nr:hypothetical protein [Clostridia bacterium]